MKSLRVWFWDNRSSIRASFVLRTVTLVAGAVLSLVWSRWMLAVFGGETYGLYLAFLGFLSLASAGELGMGGAVSIRTNQLLATGQFEELRRLHGTARRAFLFVALVSGVIVLMLSPLLPQWLHFQPTAISGSLSGLFAVGAVSVVISIYYSFLANGSYAAGNLLWPILPAFLLIQAVSASQIALGKLSAPLWVVQAASAALGLVGLGIAWLIYRHSHPVFAEALPYPKSPVLRELAVTSIWSYLFSLSALVYYSTDRLIVNAFLGAGTVPIFQLNAKLCELAGTIIVTAGAVGIPKTVTRLLSADSRTRQEGIAAAWKLARTQSFLGVLFALGYLWVNDLFIVRMYGASLRAPLELQGAVAVSLVLGANLDIFIQLAGRLHSSGLRFAALGMVVSAILNLSLSLAAAAWFHWLAGVQWATCIAQALLLVVDGIYVVRQNRLASRFRLALTSFIFPVGIVLLALHLRSVMPPESPAHALRLGGIYAAMTVVYLLAAGPGWREIRDELALARSALRREGR